LIGLGGLAALAVVVAVTALPAGAHPHGANGQILFARWEPSLGDTVLYTVNPDGSDPKQVRPEPLETPRWSPDGTRIATGGGIGGGATDIINPDDGRYRELAMPDPSVLFTPCNVWSPDGSRLACESFGQTDPSLNGIYSIRSSDGQGLTRITSNPGADDQPGDFSPDGKRLVFARSDSNNNPVGLFIVNVDGKKLKAITPAGTIWTSTGDWSPNGNEILFSRRVSDDVASSLWVVHADGTGLHELQIHSQPACGGAFTAPVWRTCLEPRWSPDGSKIVFDIFDSATAQRTVYTANADGTHLRQISHFVSPVPGEGDEGPDWGTHPIAH